LRDKYNKENMIISIKYNKGNVLIIVIFDYTYTVLRNTLGIGLFDGIFC